MIKNFSNQLLNFQASRRQIFFSTLLIFILVLAWSAILFQGLPATDTDDWYKIFAARQIDWHTHLSSFFRPWSLSPHWAGQTDSLDGIHTKRILNPLMLKFSQEIFGLNYFALYLFNKGIFFAGSVSIVFLMLIQVVPLFFAVLGILFFLFVPAHYLHVLWIADGGTVAYFFLFLGMLIFCAFQKNIAEKGSINKYLGLLLALFITGWLGIKAKESMLMLPITVFLFSLINFRRWKDAPIKFILANMTMVFIAFQIVPITNLKATDVPSFSFNFATIGRLFFRNYDCGYDNEAVSAFSSLEHVWPVSVARTLGFFILWTGIISSVSLMWNKWVLRRKGIISFWGHPLVKIAGIWLLAELPFLGMFQADPRYFSGTMAPVIILTLRLAYCAVKEAGKFWGSVLFFIWIFSFGTNIYENIQSVLSIRLRLGEKFDYFLETARTVLEDIKGEKVDNNIEVGEFYAPIINHSHLNAPIKNHIFYADLGIGTESWNVPNEQYSLENFAHYAQKGNKYYITTEKSDLPPTPEIKQIGVVDGINKGSVLERVLHALKKKEPVKIKIYKHE